MVICVISTIYIILKYWFLYLALLNLYLRDPYLERKSSFFLKWFLLLPLGFTFYNLGTFWVITMGKTSIHLYWLFLMPSNLEHHHTIQNHTRWCFSYSVWSKTLNILDYIQFFSLFESISVTCCNVPIFLITPWRNP